MTVHFKAENIFGGLMTRAAPRAEAKRAGPPASNQSRAANVAPGSYDSKSRSLGLILTTGAIVNRNFGKEELSMDPAAVDLSRVALGQVKFLDSHNQGAISAIIGTLTDARFENGILVGTVQLGESEAARAIEPDIAAGHIKGVSIGYRVDQWTLVTTGDVDTWRADKWTLMEASAVSVPADAGAMVRASESGNSERLPASASPLSMRDVRDIQRLAEGVGLRAEADALIDEGRMQRGAILEALTQKAGARQSAGTEHLRGPSPYVDAEFESGVFDRHQGNQKGTRYMNANEQTLDNPDFRARIAADYICMRTGGSPEEKATREILGGARMADIPAFLAGETGRGFRMPKLVSGFFGERVHTGSDFPIALSNGVNRALNQRLAAQKTGYADVAKRVTVPDFRLNTDVRTSGFPGLNKTLEGAEIKFGTIKEGGESYKVESYTGGISFTEQAMRNDDLGALETGTRDISFAIVNAERNVTLAALSASLSDGVALFHANHGNLAALGSAPDVSSLGAASTAMLTAKGQDGGPLGLKMRFIMAGAKHHTTLLQLVASITPAKTSDVNPYAEQLVVAIEPGITGNEWYVFADPALYPTIKFATLEGMETPRFEMEEAFNSLETRFRVVWHIGAAPVDYRGAWKNPGA